MKGLISGIKRMEIHDGDGLRTTVFFKGCPLKCIWCHNPESIARDVQIAYFKEKCIYCGECARSCSNIAINIIDKSIITDDKKCSLCLNCVDACPMDARSFFGKEYSVTELVDTVIEDKDFFINGSGGVTLSGGECLFQPNFAIEVAKEFYKRGVSVNIDTCGFAHKSVFERILPYVDTFLYDIKAIDEKVHYERTGHSNALILDNLEFLLSKGAKVEIRFPLVKNYNDNQTEKIGKFLCKFDNPPKIKVLKYHSFAGSRYLSLGMKNTLPKVITTDKDVENAVKILKENFGLNAINGVTES